MTPILQNAISPSKHTPQWILNKLRGLWRRHDALSRAVMSDDSHSPECIITLQAYTPMVSQQTTWLYEVWRGLWRRHDASRGNERWLPLSKMHNHSPNIHPNGFLTNYVALWSVTRFMKAIWCIIARAVVSDECWLSFSTAQKHSLQTCTPMVS